MHFRRLGRRSSAKFQCSFSPLITNFAEFSDFGGYLLPGNFSKLQPPEGQDIRIRSNCAARNCVEAKFDRAQRRTKVCVTLILELDFEMMQVFDSLWLYSSSSWRLCIFWMRLMRRWIFRIRVSCSGHDSRDHSPLKEGLFTNANVVFRARFRDGTSIVERTAQRSTSSMYTNDKRREWQRSRRTAESKTTSGRELIKIVCSMDLMIFFL